MTVDEWSLQGRTLAPQEPTFYGKYMTPGMFFRLNMSSFGPTSAPAPIKVTVSLFEHTTESTKVPLPSYPQTESSFDQKVGISLTGTYFVDLVNENSFTVTLQGEVLVQQEKTTTNYRTVFPYAIPGVFIFLAGATALAYGILKKPKRTPRYKRPNSER